METMESSLNRRSSVSLNHEAHRFVPRVTHEARRRVSKVMHRHAATLVQSNGVRWWFVGVLAELGVQASDFVHLRTFRVILTNRLPFETI